MIQLGNKDSTYLQKQIYLVFSLYANNVKEL